MVIAIRNFKPKNMDTNNYVLDFNSQQMLNNRSTLRKKIFYNLYTLSLRGKWTIYWGPMSQYCMQ